MLSCLRLSIASTLSEILLSGYFVLFFGGYMALSLIDILHMFKTARGWLHQNRRLFDGTFLVATCLIFEAGFILYEPTSTLAQATKIAMITLFGIGGLLLSYRFLRAPIKN